MRNEYIESLFDGFGLKVDVIAHYEYEGQEQFHIATKRGAPESDYIKLHDIATFLRDDGIFDHVPSNHWNCMPFAMVSINNESTGF